MYIYIYTLLVLGLKNEGRRFQQIVFSAAFSCLLLPYDAAATAHTKRGQEMKPGKMAAHRPIGRDRNGKKNPEIHAQCQRTKEIPEVGASMFGKKARFEKSGLSSWVLQIWGFSEMMK